MSGAKPLHAIYSLECLERHKLALQKGAHARMLLLRCEALTQYGLRPGLLFEALLASDLYHYSDTGHLSLPLKGVHGPFATERMQPGDFVEIPHSRWLLEIVSLIQQDKWQLPRLAADEAEQVARALESMFHPQMRVFRLQLCEAFNASSYHRRGGDGQLSDHYHHEWSHALSEFHEYILVDERTGRCDCLMLSYE